jgi:hypothetical protein
MLIAAYAGVENEVNDCVIFEDGVMLDEWFTKLFQPLAPAFSECMWTIDYLLKLAEFNGNGLCCLCLTCLPLRPAFKNRRSDRGIS